MTIKSLLLGSAAALVAVTGARAADVIVPAAAEPAEYVKVCDVYGTGFYYIPGTETCLQISGYVRFKVYAADNSSNSEGDDYRSTTETRVRLNFDVREETELGTLRAFARVQATNGGSFTDQPYSMDLGYIQLGGLTMGYLDTLWTEGDGLLTDTDLPVGDFQVNRISYNYKAGAFSLAGSLEDDNSGDFTPNFVARVGYESDLFGAYLAGSIDSNTDDSIYGRDFGDFFLDEGDQTDTAVAVKGGVLIKPFDGAKLKVEGSYAFDPSQYSTLGLYRGVVAPEFNGIDLTNVTGTLPVEWQAGAGYAQTFGKLGVAVSGVYGETFDYFGISNGVSTNFGSGEYYKLVGNVGYEITDNFDVLGEISYSNVDFDDAEIDQTGGFIQFVRSF